MSLERGRLAQLCAAQDLDGICAWVDEVVHFAKETAVDEHNAEVARVVGPEPANLREAIQWQVNRHSAENGSDTPDFVLAEYLTDCLAAFDKAVRRRREWHGVNNQDL